MKGREEQRLEGEGWSRKGAEVAGGQNTRRGKLLEHPILSTSLQQWEGLIKDDAPIISFLCRESITKCLDFP